MRNNEREDKTMSIRSKAVNELCEHIEQGGLIRVISAASEGNAYFETIKNEMPKDIIVAVDDQGYYVGGGYHVCRNLPSDADIEFIATVSHVADALEERRWESSAESKSSGGGGGGKQHELGAPYGRYIKFRIPAMYTTPHFRRMNYHILGISTTVLMEAEKNKSDIEVTCTEAQFGLWIATRYQLVADTMPGKTHGTVESLQPQVLYPDEKADGGVIKHDARKWKTITKEKDND